MTLGEKIASARKEKGMTQEMLAEQLGVTRQAVARWETGKALPGTANQFMLRATVGYPAGRGCFGSEIDRNKRTRCTGKGRNGRKPDSKTNVGTDCGNGNFAMACSAICWAWRGDWIVDTSVHFNKRTLFYSGGKKRRCNGCKSSSKAGTVFSGSNTAGGTFMVHCFCGICKLPKYSDVERTTRCMAAIPHSCRMDAAL